MIHFEPGWTITMHMWPIPEPPEAKNPPPGEPVDPGGPVEPVVPPPPPNCEDIDDTLLSLKEWPSIYAKCK